MATQMATHQIVGVFPPTTSVYRISILGVEPFAPPPWDRVGDNRFDDPRGTFRVIYCASEPAGSYGETLARYRRSPTLLALMRAVNDDDESFDEAVDGFVDPADEARGVIPFDWRFKRQIGATILDHRLVFADIVHPETIAHLRTVTAPVVSSLGLKDFDLSTIFSSERIITQECAGYIHGIRDDIGEPIFAGIKYPSRLNESWTCWAIFDDRLIHRQQFLETTIDLDDHGFQEAARLLDLSIEAVRGHGNFIRP